MGRSIRRFAWFGLAAGILLAGCVTRVKDPVERGPDAEAPADAAGDSVRVECDRAKVVVPAARESELRRSDPAAGPPFMVALGSVEVVTREEAPEVEWAGEDFSVVAEGIVRVSTRTGKVVVEEGPFRTLVLRNGKMLRR